MSLLSRLIAAFRQPSPTPHQRGARTQAAKRSARKREHLQRWIEAGVATPKAIRLLGGDGR